MDLARIHNIYLRAPNWVGDFVMATGAFERLRLAFPQARIVLGARPHLPGLVTGTDWFDTVIPARRASGLRALLAQVRELRAEKFDLAVILPNSLETGLVPFLARVPSRLGYQQGRPGLMNLGLSAAGGRGFFSWRGPRRTPEPMPDYYARLLDQLTIPVGRTGTVLRVTAQERDSVDGWLRGRGLADRRIVLLTAGAAFGVSKLWLPERFVAVARAIEASGDAAVFLAGPDEVEMAERLADEAGCVAATRPVLKLDELKALVARCAAMITTDTGPRHIAVALDRPVVCLIGPNDPRYTNYSLGRTQLIRKELECSPCQRKVCPLGHHDCMRSITVAEVLAALKRALA